jgi:hypothetical protein
MSSELLETKPLTVGEKVFLEKIVERCPTMRDEDEECHKRFVRGYWEEVKKHGPEGGFDPPIDVKDSGQDLKNLEEAIEEYSGNTIHCPLVHLIPLHAMHSYAMHSHRHNSCYFLL